MPIGIKGFQKGHTINVGKKRSKETKIKIGLANAIALKGNKPSRETRKKMSEARRNDMEYLSWLKNIWIK